MNWFLGARTKHITLDSIGALYERIEDDPGDRSRGSWGRLVGLRSILRPSCKLRRIGLWTAPDGLVHGRSMTNKHKDFVGTSCGQWMLSYGDLEPDYRTDKYLTCMWCMHVLG